METEDLSIGGFTGPCERVWGMNCKTKNKTSKSTPIKDSKKHEKDTKSTWTPTTHKHTKST